MSHLKKWHGWTFKYDDDGNLIEKYKGGGSWFSSKEERWQYKWDAFGMLKEVKRPDKQKVTFTYDALGRRLTKHFSRTTTHFLWSGNVPLHEWKETFEFNYSTGLYDLGTEHSPITWIFEAGSFVPCGKITNGKHYSIITDHLGTPIEAYNQEGELIWEREQDLYGNSRQGFTKENFRCPFKYQGQYYDPEIELCYNRFRYYHPETGRYISEDPIGFLSGEPNFFAYVSDTNAWVDLLGLNTNPETAAEWEARLAKIAPNEKYVAASGKLKKVAEKNGWEKDNKLTKKNNRTVYRDPEIGKIYAFDTQHGRFEVLDKNGNHIDEVDIDGKAMGKKDKSGGHNIYTK